MATHPLDLKTAVYEIHSAYDEQPAHRQPFFFVVGAGIASPSVPLSRDIIQHCREKVGVRADSADEPPVANRLGTYSYWFDKAYPQPADRQRYLRGLIENKPLSAASLRLAHVLASKRVANLVVTPNFDDFVSRALTIFGSAYTVSDHPDTVDRIDLASDDLKIVHAHGSYKFYDCRNLLDEVERRARPSIRTTRTMAAFLDRALSFGSPLIVGYAGWEDDVIMSALRRRLEGASLPYRLYWFVHRLDELIELEARASWLTDHPDVRVVVSQPVVVEAAKADDSTRLAADDAAGDLSAQLVFEQITRAFDLGEPEITRSPVAFFANQLRATLLQESGQATLGGIYSFETVVDRLDRAAALEQADWDTRRLIDQPASLDLVRRLVRSSQYAEAVRCAGAIADELDDADRRELYDLLNSAVSRNDLEPEVRIARADLLMHVGSATPSIATSARFAIEKANQAMTKGEALYGLEKLDEAIAVYDGVLAEIGDSTEPELAAACRYVLTRKALALNQSGETQEAIRLYEAVLPKLAGFPKERWLVTQGEFNRAVFLKGIGRTSEAINALAEFVSKNRHAEDGWTQVLVARALEREAEVHDELGKSEEAAAAIKQLLDLYRNTQHSQVAAVVGRELLHLAELSQRAGDAVGMIEILEEFDTLAKRTSLSKGILKSARRLRRAPMGNIPKQT